MIKFQTPHGEYSARHLETAIKICNYEAEREADRSIGIYQTLSTDTHIKIHCNKKTWIIEKPNQQL